MSAVEWKDLALAFIQDHPHLVGLLVFLLGLGEGIALVSLFIPSSMLFLLIGSAHSAVGGSFWPIWLWGAAGACIGDLLSYGLGRYLKGDAARVWPISRYPYLIPRGEGLVEKWGPLSVIGGKFVGGLRPFIPVAAGMLGMPGTVFVAASSVSCLLWAGAFLAPGYGVTFLLR
jgi:membrane protein DedA with SNARE-associated domain